MNIYVLARILLDLAIKTFMERSINRWYVFVAKSLNEEHYSTFEVITLDFYKMIKDNQIILS